MGNLTVCCDGGSIRVLVTSAVERPNQARLIAPACPHGVAGRRTVPPSAPRQSRHTNTGSPDRSGVQSDKSKGGQNGFGAWTGRCLLKNTIIYYGVAVQCGG